MRICVMLRHVFHSMLYKQNLVNAQSPTACSQATHLKTTFAMLYHKPESRKIRQKSADQV